MRSLPCAAIAILALAAGPAPALRADPPEQTLADLERTFREVPPAARLLTGPLFWLHGDESRERLEMYVGKVAEGGNGCFTAESRPHSDWLGEGWFRDLAICLDAAKKNGLKMWIFDEKWWPSGEVAGMVPERYGSKRLQATAADVRGPAPFAGAGYGGQNFIAAVAGRAGADGAIDGASLVDLSGSIKDGALSWEAPAGTWKVMKFTWAPHKSGGRYLVDGASAGAVDWYIRTVYQPHFDRFPADFGKDILGFFYDEPETHGDWGTEVLKVLAERGVDWKRALVARKFELAGEEQVAARYAYADALAEAWGRTLYGGIRRWCEAHGVKSIGHFLEHSNCYLHPDLCAGDMMALQKHSSMGAIDAVFDQFIWGKRVTRDAPCWQTPKLGSSVTHAYGKPDDVAMVEIFGARGQDLAYPEMKWWADHMHVSGIHFLIPHSFNPRAPHDTDCPPYFYDGGFEPRWPLYRVFADYTSRLGAMLTGGRHACPVALLFLGHSAGAGKHILPDVMSEALQDALYDCDWIPYEVFEGDMRIAGKELRLREESYRILVVPPAEVVPYATMAKAKEFFDAGGVVVGHGFLPARSATLGKGAADIARLREAVWGDPRPGLAASKTSAAGGRSYLLPAKPSPADLRTALAGDAGVRPDLDVVEGDTANWLHVLHRVKAGRDIFFVTNGDHAGAPRRFRFSIAAGGEPEWWDPMRNEIAAVAGRRDGERTEVDLTLQPNESVLLVFAEGKRDLPPHLDAGSPDPLRTIPIVRDALPPAPVPAIDDKGPSARLKGCSWIWFPEGNPATSAPPGTRYFRKSIPLTAGGWKIAKATFFGTADNSLVLFVDGKEAGRSDSSPEGWRQPTELDVTSFLRPGANALAVAATNATEKPSPAGLVGVFSIEIDRGEPLAVRIDGSWKASREAPAGWAETGFDDAAWPRAMVVAPFGGVPWGTLGGGGITLGPVKADPFAGHFDVPADLDLARSIVHLEMDGVAPEAAARVTVDGRYAGGAIGLPLRLDVTARLRPGRNEVRIEPFAPKEARLAVRAR